MLGILITNNNGVQYSILRIEYAQDKTYVVIQNQENGETINTRYDEILPLEQIVQEIMK